MEEIQPLVNELMAANIIMRRERMNRQINERLKTLISAYRTLGGSFTGQLTVDPYSRLCKAK